jgi:large subunit ribosomal protein L25
MKLQLFRRKGEKKGELQRIRYAGDIPAVVYGPREGNISVFIKGAEFSKIQRQLGEGALSTQVFSLEMDSEMFSAILKEIQYHRTSYRIQHMDFFRLEKDRRVKLNVPIVLEGMADCMGVKLGGVLRQTTRFLRVECLPKDIPTAFYINVQNLQMLEAKRLADIEIPDAIRPLGKMQEVAVIVAKR